MRWRSVFVAVGWMLWPVWACLLAPNAAAAELALAKTARPLMEATRGYYAEERQKPRRGWHRVIDRDVPVIGLTGPRARPHEALVFVPYSGWGPHLYQLDTTKDPHTAVHAIGLSGRKLTMKKPLNVEILRFEADQIREYTAHVVSFQHGILEATITSEKALSRKLAVQWTRADKHTPHKFVVAVGGTARLSEMAVPREDDTADVLNYVTASPDALAVSLSSMLFSAIDFERRLPIGFEDLATEKRDQYESALRDQEAGKEGADVFVTNVQKLSDGLFAAARNAAGGMGGTVGVDVWYDRSRGSVEGIDVSSNGDLAKMRVGVDLSTKQPRVQSMSRPVRDGGATNAQARVGNAILYLPLTDELAENPTFESP